MMMREETVVNEKFGDVEKKTDSEGGGRIAGERNVWCQVQGCSRDDGADRGFAAQEQLKC